MGSPRGSGIRGDGGGDGGGGLDQTLGSPRGSGVPGDGGGDGGSGELFSSGGSTPTNDFLGCSQVTSLEYGVCLDINRLFQQSTE